MTTLYYAIGICLDSIACLFLREGVLKRAVVSAISVYAETIKLVNRPGSAQCVCCPLWQQWKLSVSWVGKCNVKFPVVSFRVKDAQCFGRVRPGVHGSVCVCVYFSFDKQHQLLIDSMHHC